MVLSLLKNRALKKAMESSKASYYKAANLKGLSREARIFKGLIAGRARAHLDKVFIEGAHQAEAHQEACLRILTEGGETPEMPEPKPFQMVKTKTESVYTYVPAEFAKEMYIIGSLYQAASIGPTETLRMAQEVADKVSLDLGLDEPFIAVQFLRDELEEAGGEINASTEAKGGEAEDT